MTDKVGKAMRRKNSLSWIFWLIILISVILSMDNISDHMIQDDRSIELYERSQNTTDTEENENETNKEKNITVLEKMNTPGGNREPYAVNLRFCINDFMLVNNITPPPEQTWTKTVKESHLVIDQFNCLPWA